MIVSDTWLDHVRLARDLGNLKLLLPEGIDDIWDLPYPLFEAIKLALVFLRYEELPGDEQPPNSIWLDADEMGKWWKAVDRRRKEKYGLKSDDDDIRDVPIDGPVERNAAVNDLLV